LFVFSIVGVLILFISVLDWRKKKRTAVLDYILFGVTGFLGLSLSVLWLFTDHHASASNLNLLWAFPLHLPILFVLHKNLVWVKKYFLGFAMLMVVVVLGQSILPQPLPFSLFPLWFGLGVRAFLIAFLGMGRG